MYKKFLFGPMNKNNFPKVNLVYNEIIFLKMLI